MSLAKRIGAIVHKSERAVKYHAARMMLEVLAGRALTNEEAKLVYNRVQHWNPEG
jgi:hypothetical protein